MKGASILIVDDEEGIRHGLENLFRREGFTVHAAAGCDSAVSAAAKFPIDVAVVDIRLRGGQSGIDLLKQLKVLEPDIVVIVITGFGSIDTAVASLKAGAADYFLKPIDNGKLLDAVRKNLALRALASENRFLRDELNQRSIPHQFVTQDPAVRALIGKADKVKDTPVTVLITGESGTGKEVLARYIHCTSTRREAEFVPINCAALSESLLLSELFGHELGAFTGAVERKRGKFELADGGTLFLDEIGDMSAEIQAKLLRVIEESSFERVGGVKRISVDVRIIAATNKDLPALIRKGRFRDDLYYRLNVVSFHLPPLRERRGDIPLLVVHFLTKYSERYSREPVTPAAETMAALTALDWPGNARELENVMNQMVLLGEKSFTVQASTALVVEQCLEPGPDIPAGTALKRAVEAMTGRCERRLIAESLERNGGNKSKTARELVITRKTLAKKMAKHGL
jgi:two-component system NtrC family response regulator